MKQIHSSIVLAGDPKQLDAVTKSRYAIKLGFKMSFMEHLFNRRLYQRDPETGDFNQKYITQLVKNYRSHSVILHIPNDLFYENKLQVEASSGLLISNMFNVRNMKNKNLFTENTDWFIDSKLLPSQKFPIIFKSVQGFCKKSTEDFR